MEIREVDSRQENKAKKHRSKARAVVFAFSFLIVLALALWVLAYTVLFPVEQIKLSGNTIYTSQEIIDSTNISLGDKLFGISRKNTEEILTRELPYIKTVEFKRSILPETALEIVVTETTDVYCYEYKNMYYTADADNKVLAKFTAQPQGTTLVKTNEKFHIVIGRQVQMNEDNFNNLSTIYSSLTENRLSIGYIDISNDNNISILIDNRFIVDLGTVSNLDGKVAHLNGMIEKVIEKNGNDTQGYIDLSAWTNKNQRAYYEPSNIF